LITFVWGSTLLAGAIGAFATSVVDNATIQQRKRLKLYAPIDEDHDGSIGCYDWLNYYANNILVAVGWNTHYRKYLTFLSMTLWIGLGIYYGTVYEQWTSGFALYYSVAAISGSGASPPVCEGEDDENCSLGSFRAYFMTFYLIVGVPLFTLTLGQFSLALVEKAVRSRELNAMLQPLSEEEYEFACTLDTRDSRASKDQQVGIDLAQFLVMEMLRLKRFDRDDIYEIKELFNAIDYDNQGVITTEKLHKCHLFSSDIAPNSSNNNNNHNSNISNDNSDSQYNTFTMSQYDTSATTPAIYNNLLYNLRNQSPHNNVASKPSLNSAANLVVNVNRLRRNTTSGLDAEEGEPERIGNRLKILSSKMRRHSVDSNNYTESSSASSADTSNRKPFQT